MVQPINDTTNQTSRWYWMHCLSPLHIGSGEGAGIIDLPIIREKVTEWPLIPSSGLKGAQRSYYRAGGKEQAWLDKAFGREGDQDGQASALVMTDGRLLAFPVASRYGTFAYVTCPLAIQRLMRDARAAGRESDMGELSITAFEQDVSQGTTAWVTDDTVILGGTTPKEQLCLDEFEGKAVQNEAFAEWAKKLGKQLFSEDEPSQKLWQERAVLVPDDIFQYFVTMCCEVTPRIRINDDTKTTKQGALWYEEYVPAEALFYGLVWCDRTEGNSAIAKRHELLNSLESVAYMQLGGNTSVGKGRVRCAVTGGNS